MKSPMGLTGVNLHPQRRHSLKIFKNDFSKLAFYGVQPGEALIRGIIETLSPCSH